jgi:hypothetical protein
MLVTEWAVGTSFLLRPSVHMLMLYLWFVQSYLLKRELLTRDFGLNGTLLPFNPISIQITMVKRRFQSGPV